MKKSTINTILISVIALMSVSICFLIFCIATRPRYVIVSEPQTETAVITEMSGIAEDLQSETASAPVDVVDSAIDGTIPSDDMQGKTSTRVNIRNAASADAKVLDTVEGGTTFKILEIQDNGWTKIQYEETEPYISSDYVIRITE